MIFDNKNSHRNENSFVINRKKIILIVKQMKNKLKISDLIDYEL